MTLAGTCPMTTEPQLTKGNGRSRDCPKEASVRKGAGTGKKTHSRETENVRDRVWTRFLSLRGSGDLIFDQEPGGLGMGRRGAFNSLP